MVRDPQTIMIIGAGAALALLLLAMAGGEGNPRFERRLARAGQEVVRAPAGGGSVRRSTHYSAIPGLDALLKRVLPNRDKLRRRLARTGRSITLGQYVLASAVLAGLAALLSRHAFAFPAALALPVGLAVGTGVPHMVVGVMGARRVARFIDGFPDAIDLICRGLRSGLPVVESLMTVGRELPDPIGVEFRRIGDAVRLGRSLDEAMWEVAGRLDAPEFKFLIIAMSIQRETGGNLAETLGNLAALLRKRRQLKLKIKALSSEAKASAWIIGSLPFAMFGIIMLMSPDYATVLLNDARGQMMLGFGLFMIGLGAAVMGKMVRFEI
ncbi:MAG TPA: type II secretion system F family protein [Azospirillaceae bacterium]|nr:type II secretion system F family protein [Azospirillaceae bacterium]